MAIGINPYAPPTTQPGNTVNTPGAVNTPVTGSGNLAGVGRAPDAPPPSAMGAAMASLAAMMPKVRGQDLDVLLLDVTSKMKDTIDKSEKSKIETDTSTKRAQIGEKQAKMKEANEKLEAAQKKLDDLSIWDKIKIGFQYLGAILAVVAGAITMAIGAIATATGILAPAGIAALVGGGMMISSGIMMLYMAADATHAALDKDGLGFHGANVRDAKLSEGLSETDALKAANEEESKVRTIIGGVAAGLAILGSFLTIPMGAALMLPAMITGVVAGVNQMAIGAGDLTVALLTEESTQDKADATTKKADAKTMEAMIRSLDDMIDMAMTRMKGAGDRFNAMLDSLTDAIKDRGDTMARVGFRA